MNAHIYIYIDTAVLPCIASTSIDNNHHRDRYSCYTIYHLSAHLRQGDDIRNRNVDFFFTIYCYAASKCSAIRLMFFRIVIAAIDKFSCGVYELAISSYAVKHIEAIYLCEVQVLT